MNDFTNVIFHSLATVAADGRACIVNGYRTLTIEIYGTSTSRTITFNGKSKSGTMRAIMGVELSDLSTATSTTSTGEIWQFDVAGLEEVVIDLTAVAGGNVSIKGRLVA